jgi:hypothetical protein
MQKCAPQDMPFSLSFLPPFLDRLLLTCLVKEVWHTRALNRGPKADDHHRIIVVLFVGASICKSWRGMRTRLHVHRKSIFPLSSLIVVYWKFCVDFYVMMSDLTDWVHSSATFFRSLVRAILVWKLLQKVVLLPLSGGESPSCLIMWCHHTVG